MKNLAQYNKAFVPIVAGILVQLAQWAGIDLPPGVLTSFAPLIAGFVLGAGVWAIRNAPPELIDAIEEAMGDE